MEKPDVIGLELGEALGVLAKYGVKKIRKVITQPPGAVICQGEARVLRTKVIGPDEVELLFAHRDFQIPGKEV